MSTAVRNTQWGSATIDTLIALGTPHFCVVAGSRSTPLAAAAVEQTRVACDVFTDERSAAFFALGVGRATGRPAVIITTSGTAVANLAPAIHEASASSVPLLALTADRPPELRHTGANQTIEQPGIFGTAVRWQFDMPCPTAAISMRALRSTVAHAYARTLSTPPGPVHLNCMYRKPLGPDQVLDTQAEDVHQVRAPAQPLLGLRNEDADHLRAVLRSSRRGLVVIGALDATEERQAALELANKLGWPVFSDIASGLRLDPSLTYALDPFDALLSSDLFVAACAPDCIVHLGGPVVSGRYLQWRERVTPDEHVLIRPDPRRQDPTHHVTRQLTAHISAVNQALPNIDSHIDTGWRTTLCEAALAVRDAWSQAFTNSNALSEPAVTRHLAASINAQSGWMLSNSMPIRNADLFSDRNANKTGVITNRGASGIDGILSTAIGWSQASSKPVTVLLGDQALLHDLNALSLVQGARYPVRIVVINNGGGGIFSFLPIAEDPALVESTFAVPHQWRFAPIAKNFGLETHTPETLDDFVSIFERAQNAPKSCLIEVLTERIASRDLHTHLRKLARQTADKTLPGS